MIPLPSELKVSKKGDNIAVFEIEGFYPGYGVTIGNGLRRILLSSLEGAAITQVKIKGVLHEFSTIPGVLEDVVIILLNLKKVRFKMFTQEPQIISLSVKGEREATAGDFKLTPSLETSNPGLHIATLTKASSEFIIEAQVERGVGYEPVERREIKKFEVGVMPIDAVFTPVKRVSFNVENTRVGKRTDFDRLRIEIETDGTVSPEETLKQTTEILLNHFTFLYQTASKEALGEEKPEGTQKQGKKKTPKEPGEIGSSEAKKNKVEDLDISERTKNALLGGGIKTIGGLLKKSEKELRELEGFGEKALEEIKKEVKKIGIELKPE